MNKIVHKDLSYKVNGLCYKVHGELNRFCREKQYADVLEKKLEEAHIPYERGIFLAVTGSHSVDGNKPDFVIDHKIILDAKAKNFVTKEDYFQMQRYLQTAGLELGLIVNFRSSHLKPIRVLNSSFGLFGCDSGHSGRIRGFTIIESLVAVAILLLALTGPMALAERSLAAAEVARRELTVLYLAQEGMEFVRSVRDSNFLQYKGNKDVKDKKDKWLAVLDSCFTEAGCGVDLTQTNKDNPENLESHIFACKFENKDCLLTQNTSSEKVLAKGLFSHRFVNDQNGTWESTDIHRKICITLVDAVFASDEIPCEAPERDPKDENEIKVNVIMDWKAGALGDRKTVVSSNLSNWYLSK